MARHELSTGIAQAAWEQFRIATLLLVVLGGVGAARAADEAASKPLDLSLPRQAGQWTGVASQARQDDRPKLGAGSQQPRSLAVHSLPQPYGTGYEARMSAGASAGAAGATGAGPQGGGNGAPGGPRGGNGKGR